MNIDDVKKQAQWELDIERFERAVEREKQRLRQKKIRFPWRLKLINLNNGVNQ